IGGLPTNAPGWIQQPLDPTYEWGDTSTIPLTYSWVVNESNHVVENVDFYQQNMAWPGSGAALTTGTAVGLWANRPATCTPGLGGGAPGRNLDPPKRPGKCARFVRVGPPQPFSPLPPPPPPPPPPRCGPRPGQGFPPAPPPHGDRQIFQSRHYGANLSGGGEF